VIGALSFGARLRLFLAHGHPSQAPGQHVLHRPHGGELAQDGKDGVAPEIAIESIGQPAQFSGEFEHDRFAQGLVVVVFVMVIADGGLLGTFDGKV